VAAVLIPRGPGELIMRRLITRAGCVALGLALALGCGGGPDAGGPKGGTPAPDFTAQAGDGHMVSLSELRGKVVVLSFWATWCAPCRTMISHERDLVKKYEGQPFAFIGISADDEREAFDAALKDEQITWPNIQDGEGGPIHRLYQVESLPTFYVI